LWRKVFTGTRINGQLNQIFSLAVDSAGNVIAGGRLENEETGPDVFLVKLSGSTGSEIWGQEVIGSSQSAHLTDCIFSVAIDQSDDVAAVGILDKLNPQNQKIESNFVAIKFVGDTGGVAWQHYFGPLASANSSESMGLSSDPEGNLMVAGWVVNRLYQDTFLFAKLSLQGNEVWRRTIDGSERGRGPDGRAHAVAHDKYGHVVAAGFTSNKKSGSDFIVATVSSRGVLGKRIIVQDNALFPEKRQVEVRPRDPDFEMPQQGDPTLGGAVIEIVNPLSGERDRYALPAERWHRLIDGNYSYRDPFQEVGPCEKVDIRTGELDCFCSGNQIQFSLDEPIQGAVAFKLKSFGTSEITLCAVFGGTIVHDKYIQGDRTVRFSAKNSPRPETCP
jgi:hypothetical protein